MSQSQRSPSPSPSHAWPTLAPLLQGNLQAEVSLDPSMSNTARYPIAAARHPPFPVAIRKRMVGFPGIIEEGFTTAIALALLPGHPATARLVADLARHREPGRVRFRFFRGTHAIAAETDTTAVSVIGLWRAGQLSHPALRAGALLWLLYLCDRLAEPGDAAHGPTASCSRRHGVQTLVLGSIGCCGWIWSESGSDSRRSPCSTLRSVQSSSPLLDRWRVGGWPWRAVAASMRPHSPTRSCP
ncbi:MAG: hypothetical protein ACI8RZ_005757 [Myxococcota bacterium]|jgi:hypothetical protein